MKVCVFHTAFLGDLVMIGLMIDALFKAGHEIVLVTNAGGAKIYEHDERLSERIVVQKKSGLKKWGAVKLIVKKLLPYQFDVFVTPHRSFTTGIIAFTSRIPRRVSFENCAFPWAFTEVFSFAKNWHESLRCLDLLPQWLISDEIRKECEEKARPVLQAPAQMLEFSKANPEFLNSKAPFFVVSPGSVWETKIYPPELLAQVVSSLLAANATLRCVVSGGPADLKVIEKFLNALGDVRERVVDASRCLPLSELAGLTARAHFVLSNDSAPLHVASGLNVPVVGIFGPTSAKTGFGPAGERTSVVAFLDKKGLPLPCQPCSPHGHHVCPLGHHCCMRELKPQVIFEAVRKLVPELF